MKPIWKYICANQPARSVGLVMAALLLCWLPRWASAQEIHRLDSTDNIRVVADTPQPMGYDTSVVFHGLTLKFDLGGMALAMMGSNPKAQVYEAELNANLRNHYFPVVSLGYGKAAQSVENGGEYDGSGLFGRVGMDMSLMKRFTPETWRNHMLVGLRLGGAAQSYSLSGVALSDDYWNPSYTLSYDHQRRFDLWGEIRFGAQVEPLPRFVLGWSVGLSALFTRGKEGKVLPWYIPGYGRRQNSAFGLSYYVGYRF